MSAIENTFANPVPHPAPSLVRGSASWKLWAIAAGTVGTLGVCALLAVHATPEPRTRIDRFLEPGGPAGLRQRERVDGYAQSSPAPSAARMAAAPPPPPVMAAKAKAEPGLTDQPLQAQADGAFVLEAPMIARTVSLTLGVKDLAATRAALDGILQRTHGYPAQLSESSPEDGPRVLSASLRVPATALEPALAELKRLGRIANEVQGGEEVTQQHQDLVARLKTARETEERYRAILLQRTGKVSDVLEVEEQIAQVRGEIERMEADQQGLEHRVDFASVDVQFTEQYKANLAAPDDSVVTQVRNAFVAGLRHVGGSLLGVVLFAEEYGPMMAIWVVLLGGPVWLVWTRRRSVQARA